MNGRQVKSEVNMNKKDMEDNALISERKVKKLWMIMIKFVNKDKYFMEDNA